MSLTGVSQQLEDLSSAHDMWLLSHTFVKMENEAKGLSDTQEELPGRILFVRKLKSLKINAKSNRRFKMNENDIKE